LRHNLETTRTSPKISVPCPASVSPSDAFQNSPRSAARDQAMPPIPPTSATRPVITNIQAMACPPWERRAAGPIGVTLGAGRSNKSAGGSRRRNWGKVSDRDRALAPAGRRSSRPSRRDSLRACQSSSFGGAADARMAGRSSSAIPPSQIPDACAVFLDFSGRPQREQASRPLAECETPGTSCWQVLHHMGMTRIGRRCGPAGSAIARWFLAHDAAAPFEIGNRHCQTVTIRQD
jgi:hypothetical protein